MKRITLEMSDKTFAALTALAARARLNNASVIQMSVATYALLLPYANEGFEIQILDPTTGDVKLVNLMPPEGS